MRTALAVIMILACSTLVFGKPGQFHYVKPLQAEIHEGPSQDSKVKFIVAIGRKLVEFDRKDGWIYVGVDKTGGKDGWIKASQVSPTDPDGLTY